MTVATAKLIVRAEAASVGRTWGVLGLSRGVSGGVGGLFLAQFEIGGDALKKRKAKNVEMQQKTSWKGCEKLDE